MHDPARHNENSPPSRETFALNPSPALNQLVDESDSILLGVRLDTETATVRAIESRVDAKAGAFLSLASGLLLAGLALLAAGRLHGPAAVAGWTAAATVGAAVLLLTTALRPNLTGNFGFVRWAGTRTGQDLLDALAAEQDATSEQTCAERAGQLRWLSRSVHTKFSRIRTAQTLLVAGLATAAAAAALTALGR
jgi:hypothetical protein